MDNNYILGTQRKKEEKTITETKETLMLDKIIQKIEEKKEEDISSNSQLDYYLKYKNLENLKYLNKRVSECNK